MLFVITYTLPPQNRNAVQERFKQGGGLPAGGAYIDFDVCALVVEIFRHLLVGDMQSNVAATQSK